jgi:signal transduction histidine kinase
VRLTTLGRTLLFVLSALPLGVVGYVFVVAGWPLTLALAITPLVVPVLLAFGWLVRLLVLGEAAIASTLLGTPTARPPARPPVRGYWRRALAVLQDKTFWKGQVYALLRFVVGLPTAIVMVALMASGLGAATAFVWYRWIPQDGGGHGLDFGAWHTDTFFENVLLIPAGCVVLALAVALLIPIRAVWRRVATALLPKGSDAVTRPPRQPADRRRALTVHALASGGLVATETLIWALTTRAYYWPYWTLLPLAAAFGIHALVEGLELYPTTWRRGRVNKPFAVHTGVSAIVELFLVGVWAATTRWYFWPVWPLIGLSLAVLIHWAVLQMKRIDHLETARSSTVQVQETDLRRIERDLHDGAQARLVALGINLGLAEQKFETDPDSARLLVTEARDGVTDALREIRDLVRGIRPPVLADRGLEAAIAALADRHPLPVDVTAHVEPRPTDPVETAAYFIVAESLTNAAKHADATRVDVRLERHGPLLRVEIIDDGKGDADPNGAGIAGLRRRVEALDGRLTVTSPAGGPTIVRAELPCGS